MGRHWIKKEVTIIWVIVLKYHSTVEEGVQERQEKKLLYQLWGYCKSASERGWWLGLACSGGMGRCGRTEDVYLFVYLAVLGFELRPSRFLGTLPLKSHPSLLALVYFLDMVLHFFPSLPWDQVPLTYASHVAGMTGVYHHAGPEDWGSIIQVKSRDLLMD
jgi:hypothetical protein